MVDPGAHYPLTAVDPGAYYPLQRSILEHITPYNGRSWCILPLQRSILEHSTPCSDGNFKSHTTYVCVSGVSPETRKVRCMLDRM